MPLVLYLELNDKRICLPVALHTFNRTSNTGLRFITASLHHFCNMYRNINLFPIDYASRPRLRGRLTLRSLTLLRKPRACGVRVLAPHYRYSCRHSLLYTLQIPSQDSFNAEYNALLPVYILTIVSKVFVAINRNATNRL